MKGEDCAARGKEEGRLSSLRQNSRNSESVSEDPRAKPTRGAPKLVFRALRLGHQPTRRISPDRCRAASILVLIRLFQVATTVVVLGSTTPKISGFG